MKTIIFRKRFFRKKQNWIYMIQKGCEKNGKIRFFLSTTTSPWLYKTWLQREDALVTEESVRVRSISLKYDPSTRCTCSYPLHRWLINSDSILDLTLVSDFFAYFPIFLFSALNRVDEYKKYIYQESRLIKTFTPQLFIFWFQWGLNLQ